MTGTSLDSYMPYDSGPGSNVTEVGWRQFAKYFRNDGIMRGVANGFNTFGDSSGMQVKVDTGEVWIQGEWGSSTSLKVIGITNNTSGNPRVDLIVLRNDFVNNVIVVDKLVGTPAASNPVPPALTQNTSIWEIQLAKVAVASGAVTISAGNVTFLPQYTDGSAEFQLGANQNVTTATTTKLTWNTVVTASSAVHQSSSNTAFTFDRSGMWLISYGVEWGFHTGGNRWAWIANTANSGTQRLAQSIIPASSSSFTSNVGSASRRYTAGQEVAVYVFQDSGSTAIPLGGVPGTDFDATFVSFYWLGP